MKRLIAMLILVFMALTQTIPVRAEQRDDLWHLSHIIYAEAGSDWCSDKMQMFVGSVVLNRVDSEYFPDTIEEVILQKNQYSTVASGAYLKEPNERAIENAKILLEEGSWLPNYVLFQSQKEMGCGMYVQEQNMIFSSYWR